VPLPRRIRLLAFGTYLYIAAVLALWLLLRLAGDRWWVATVLLFGPRWPYAIPWPLLTALAFWQRPRLVWPLPISAIVLLGPIMGFCLPFAWLTSRDGPTIRVLTCNVDGDAVDIYRFGALVDLTKPDLVALQECPSHLRLIWPNGWHVRRTGQLLIASPHPLGIETPFRSCRIPGPWPPHTGMRCRVSLPSGDIGFCCVHLRTPRSGLSQVLDRQTLVSPARSTELANEIAIRRLDSDDLAGWLHDWPVPWLAAGDFNMPDDSSIFRSSWGHCSNAFPAAGLGFGYTKWTPIHGLSYGLRIDHILGGATMTPRRCWVGPDVGSDHLPLLADLALPAE
jgi:vancomycin resistance protein VanJ